MARETKRTGASVLTQITASATDLLKIKDSHPTDELTESYFRRVANLFTELSIIIKQNPKYPTYVVAENSRSFKQAPIVNDEILTANKVAYKNQYIAIHPIVFVYDEDNDGPMIPELEAWYHSFMAIITF